MPPHGGGLDVRHVAGRVKGGFNVLGCLDARVPEGLRRELHEPVVVHIDGLADINQEHGTDIGDFVLTSVANRLLKRTRDFAQVEGKSNVDADFVGWALGKLGVDDLGLDRMDRRILSSIAEKFGGGPVGIDTLVAMLGEERDTLSDVYEPYLMQIGFLVKTTRGRLATRAAFDYLGIPYPEHLSTYAPQNGEDDPGLFDP